MRRPTPRMAAATVVAAYGLLMIATGWHTNRVALAVGMVLMAGFVAVDGWQARRERRDRDRDAVARIVRRERTRR